jgi:PAS domain S-box-containing protein
MLAWTATEAMQGRSSVEALGHHLSDGRGCDQSSCAIRQTLTDGVTRRVAGESFRSQAGRAVSVDYAVSPLIVEGTPVGGVVIFHDVGERRAAEERVKKLLAYQQAILDNAPVGIAIYDQHRRLVEANPAFLAIFGWSAEDIIGQSARLLYLDDESFLSNGERAYGQIRQGESFRGDSLMRRQDGREIWVRLTGHLVDTAELERGVIWATEDITERKALELDIKRSNEELERFAYVASHDLRQPLRMVSGYLGLLERQVAERLDEEERSFIGFAIDGAKRMDKMIIDLLDYSRIGRQPSDKLPVDLNAELSYALRNLDLFIVEAEAEVVVPQPLPIVLGYDTELERLLQNLIGNAIKFRAEGRKPVVTVTCREEGRNWVLAIKDNGIGINPKDHARLFRVFQRLVSREQYDGTGIGLAACRKIAEHHGGRIWVESEIGEGCTFLVALPVV